MSNRVKCRHPSCSSSFDSKAFMMQHYKDRHSSSSRGPPDQLQLSAVLQQQYKFPCRHCRNRSSNFKTKADLQEHMRAVHQLNQRLTSASVGKAIAARRSAPALVPQVHRRQVEDDAVACNDCGKLFKSIDSLHHHQWDSPNHTRVSRSPNFIGASSVRACSKCSAEFRSADDLENHYMKQHPISEVSKSDEDGTWQLVAECFRSAWTKPTIKLYEVHRIFKVYNPGRRRKEFEEYRKELKSAMASQKDNSELRKQVLHDGNELRRYHGTTIKCRLGRPPKNSGKPTDAKTTLSLCRDADCSLCRILQTGFKLSKCRVKAFQRFGKGIYCTSVSSKASEYVKCNNKRPSFLMSCFNMASFVSGNYKVMMVCRVLAGRPHHSTSNLQHLKKPPSGFHSVQGDPGAALNYDELVVYDNRAILPSFIILYSSSDP